MEYVKLGEICEFINGDRGKNYPSGKDIIDSGIPFINAGHLVDGKIDMENMNYISREKFEKLGSGKVKENDILFCLRGSLGKSSICKINEGAIASSLVILRPNTDLIYTKYLMLYLNSQKIKSQIDRANNGSSQPNLSANSVKQFDIYLPKYEEQIKIAEVLDKAQELIDKRKEQIDALDDLVKSRFIEMFGNPRNKKFEGKTLPEIINDDKHALKRGPFGGSLKKDDFIEEGYLVYEQRHAIHDDFNYSKYYINKEKYEDMIAFKVEPKDLLISCSGTIGKISEVPKDAKPGIINQALLKITLNQDIMNNTYFIHLFRNDQIQDKLFGFSRGSGISNFPPMNEVKSIEFLCPPMRLQNKFANFVNQVDKLKSQMETSLKELEDNFNALMQKAFKGELFN